MNHEEEKKKELEKRGEDAPDSGRKYPDSSMTKDQRADEKKMHEKTTGNAKKDLSEDERQQQNSSRKAN